MYYGMELEMEASCGNQQDTAEALKDPEEDNWYLERDGSLNNGIEVIAHARTFESWQAFWPTYKEKVLDVAIASGCKAHDTGTCGIHIHTSLDAWEGNQLMRLFSLLYNRKNYKNILTITQRKEEKLRRWASLDVEDIGKYKYRIEDKVNPFIERYAALNITQNTLEVRIFNSNLRIERVKKNMEFVYALYCYTAKVTSRATWPGLMRWVKENRKQVSCLYDFLLAEGIITLKTAVTHGAA
jgi:hypothetical protein